MQWDYNFPQFTVDLIYYLSCFQLDDFLKQLHKAEADRKAEEQLNPLELDTFRRIKVLGDADVVYWMNKLGEDVFGKLMRFFRGVSRNPGESKDSQVFLTQDSLAKKMKVHFGHRCDFLANRLYYLLSGNVNLKRIYFRDFADKMHAVFIEGALRDQMRMAFQFVDLDNDGVLNGIDLLTVQDQIDLSS